MRSNATLGMGCMPNRPNHAGQRRKRWGLLWLMRAALLLTQAQLGLHTGLEGGLEAKVLGKGGGPHTQNRAGPCGSK